MQCLPVLRYLPQHFFLVFFVPKASDPDVKDNGRLHSHPALSRRKERQYRLRVEKTGYFLASSLAAGSACASSAGFSMPSSSTSKISMEPGSITGGAPRSP